MQTKDIHRIFTADTSTVKLKSAVLTTHTVNRGKLLGSSKNWICKEMKDPSVARTEVLAQEFFRLIIPHQPETRLAWDPTTGTHYVLSEEVPGYDSLPTGQAENFANGTYTGLGQALVCAMFLQEIDLKNGNIGLNDQKQVIKIDGDWSFAEFSFGSRYDITAASLENLPCSQDFYAFNWLDLIKQSIYYQDSQIIDLSLRNNVQFRAEVNEAINKICLLSDHNIDALVNAHIPAGAERFSTLLKTRRDTLKASAMLTATFPNYVHSPLAKSHTVQHAKQIGTFETNEQQIHAHQYLFLLLDQISTLLTPDNKTALQTYIDNVHTRIQMNTLNPKIIAKIKTELEQTLANDLFSLLDQIKSHAISDNDLLLNAYIDDVRDRIRTNILNPEIRAQIKTELEQTLASVSSSQIASVKQTIQNFRDSRRFSQGKREKAEKIETALLQTPIQQRGTILSDDKINEVQLALAQHRHPWRKKSTLTLDTPVSSIDKISVARSFTTLKHKFKTLTDDTETTPLIELPKTTPHK